MDIVMMIGRVESHGTKIIIYIYSSLPCVTFRIKPCAIGVNGSF